MPPKKATKAPKAAAAPTRRSGRIASRESSKEPSAEPSAAAPAPAAPVPAITAPIEEEPAVAASTLPSPASSAAPEPATTAAPATATRPKTAEKSTIAVNKSSTGNIILAITALSRRGRTPDRIQHYINSLTLEQQKAVILGYANQTVDLQDHVSGFQDRIQDLEEDLEYTTKQLDSWKKNSRPNLRRDAFLKKMDAAAAAEAEAEKKIAEAQTEENNTTIPVAATTTPVAASAGPVAAAQSPPHHAAQDTPATAVLPSPQAGAEEIVPAATPVASPWKRVVAGLSGFIPGLRKRPAEDEAAAAAPAPKRTRVDEPEKTPVRLRPTPKHLMRSVKDPAVPSSLSTITERSEQSLLEMAPDTTPSRKRRLDASPLPPPSSIPTSTPLPPQRRSAQAIMARRALGLNTPAPRPYAWEKQPAMQKPKEKNADARAAKLQRYNELREELERLKKDADIQEIKAHSVHRRKRVKIDDLAVIPHNRPGDPSGTFRVPDPDSDGEISVEDDWSENSNVFDGSEKAEEEPVAQDAPVEPLAPVFVFPEVGQRPLGYHVTEEYREAAGNLFAEGLAAFMAV